MLTLMDMLNSPRFKKPTKFWATGRIRITMTTTTSFLTLQNQSTGATIREMKISMKEIVTSTTT